MKKIYYVLVLLLICISCKNIGPQKQSEKAASITINTNENFETFKSKFYSKGINNFDSLLYYLFDGMNQIDKKLTKVESKYYKSFLKDIDTTDVYYGYKTELPDNCVLLSVINHHGKHQIKGSIIDTIFVTMIYYDGEGNPLGNFRVFASDLPDGDPTYSMISTFESNKDRLKINNYEYTIGNDFTKIEIIDDSIIKAESTVTSFEIDYIQKKFNYINKYKEKTKVIATSEYQFEFLKPFTWPSPTLKKGE